MRSAVSVRLCSSFSVVLRSPPDKGQIKAQIKALQPYLAKPISKTELLSRVKTHLDLLGKHRRVLWLNEGLETRNAEMAQFNYTVAHDLKSPVVTIKNFLGSLKHDLEDGRTDRLAIRQHFRPRAASRHRLV